MQMKVVENAPNITLNESFENLSMRGSREKDTDNADSLQNSVFYRQEEEEEKHFFTFADFEDEVEKKNCKKTKYMPQTSFLISTND